jgi:hypothetical protein
LSNDSQATCDEDLWRNHALSLEKELESLKQKREEDEAGVFESPNFIPSASLANILQNSFVCGKTRPRICQTTLALLPQRRKQRRLVKPRSFNFRQMTGLQNGKV